MRVKLLVLGMSILISVLAVEGVLRLLYDVPPDWLEPQVQHLEEPMLGWILPQNDQSFTIDAPVRTNSLGLRDDEMPIEKPPGEIRILSGGQLGPDGGGVRLDRTVLLIRVRR